ncbi:MAG TPA: methionine ABC transporter ATP-binding protein [Clostridia bacterium]|jgi:D-methionine transport system ATP-binding protein|nr:methionine ABC transporter ATP-binding protein [Clostridia bacterium]
MIEIKELKKIYGHGKNKVVALDGIDLNIKPGEIFGIIGLSGAGKSTLIRCLNMLEKPTKGKVIIDGFDLTSLSGDQLRSVRRRIGMIFQHFNLLWSRTVADNIAFPLEIAGEKDKGKIEARVNELLDLVDLSDKANAYPAQLSGGQKQRVGIARALANNPKVLLCDEATSALDPQTTGSILELLANINKKLGITMVIITHEMAVIKAICDKVAVIEDGKIVESGPVFDLFTNPHTKTARRFISTINSTELPDVILERQKISRGHSKLIRISFIGSSAGEPIISDMIQKFNIKANILYGNIDHIKNNIFGTLTVQLIGADSNTSQALTYLEGLGLKVEVINVE